jgi:hypothetical protein
MIINYENATPFHIGVNAKKKNKQEGSEKLHESKKEKVLCYLYSFSYNFLEIMMIQLLNERNTF